MLLLCTIADHAKEAGDHLAYDVITSCTGPKRLSSLGLRFIASTLSRKVKGREVYTLGEATAGGLRRLLTQLGADQGGPAHAVVTDVREEMVAYIAGRPYLRRELEMPAAAFHHAGDCSNSSCTVV